jgi:DNA-binding response OmpR family regulator
MFLNNEILVVDSDTHTLSIVKDALLQNGFIVHFSHKCELAMQMAIKNKPDLILSEMALQDIDGLEFMRMVQKTPEISQVPFIFLTSRTLIKDKITALEGGADDYITKPFNENELVARISAVLRRSDKSKISIMTKEDGIKGNLKDINLLDLIQLFDMGRKTAVIQVEGTGKEGRVYFDSGEVVHAVCGKLFGKEALFEILSIRQGTFLIHLNISSKIRTIHHGSTTLVMEAMHHFDENNISPGANWGQGSSLPLSRKSPLSDGIKELFEEGVIEEYNKP